ncbi:conserved hypothetical protein [Hyella patelloides LEGE 07179]|uniref:Nucleotide-diphospho-sugar transferase domain-containing protein n=1 Tax=Hyella patelloides LEGE 07179 TaxID=945734 RepID=A0A563W3D6_9CYAN|nr:hypothetical protein [Hyella patelloides]VEP18229.1 conserved hypothetical protein [Hyella patelloides LEGE 07179]
MKNSLGIDFLCFCTSAFGEKYNLMAKLLAQDLQQFAPGCNFIIYTDRPHIFNDNSNVRAVKHSCRGVMPYHERRFAIWDALSVSSSVMYLDADVRICAPVPQNLKFLPGLTARSCGSLQKHIQRRFNQKSQSNKSFKKRYIIEKMAHRISIDLDSPELKFINEFLFAINKDRGRELEFLKIWGDLAIYADTLGMHKHPTYAMTLAAAKSNFPIHHSRMTGLDFFDDRIEKTRISKNQSTSQAKSEYFNQQKNIEKKKKNIFQNYSDLIIRNSSCLYNRARVQLTSKTFPSTLVNYPELNQR